MIGNDSASQVAALTFHGLLHTEYLIGLNGVLYTNVMDGALPAVDWIGSSQWQVVVVQVAHVGLHVAQVEHGVSLSKLPRVARIVEHKYPVINRGNRHL